MASVSPSDARRSTRAYVIAALGGWIGCLAALALFNAIADPYCAYRIGPHALDPYRRAYSQPGTKAERVLELNATTLIVGTSRGFAFDPRSKHWRGEPTYNMSLPGVGLPDIADAVHYLTERGRLKRLFLCVDYLQFGVREFSSAKTPTFSAPRSNWRFSPDFVAWKYHTQNLLTPAATWLSVNSLINYGLDLPSRYTDMGDVDEAIAPWGGPRERFVQTVRDYNTYYGMFHRCDDSHEPLKRLVRECVERGVELTVVVAPVHALHLEAIARNLGEEDYGRWLVELASLVDRESGGRTPVWDFSGYNAYTTEPAPTSLEAGEMSYYVESSHFNRALAEKVLARVYGAPDADRAFGRRIDSTTVGTHVAALHRERAEWLAGNSTDLELFAQVVRDSGYPGKTPQSATGEAPSSGVEAMAEREAARSLK